jgi:hypothetical protein
LRTPVIVVESVIAGVVVALATVPAKPFADTTETVVTVPPLPEYWGMLSVLPINVAAPLDPVVVSVMGA